MCFNHENLIAAGEPPSGGKQDFVKRRGNESSYQHAEAILCTHSTSICHGQFFQFGTDRREEKRSEGFPSPAICFNQGVCNQPPATPSSVSAMLISDSMEYMCALQPIYCAYRLDSLLRWTIFSNSHSIDNSYATHMGFPHRS